MDDGRNTCDIHGAVNTTPCMHDAAIADSSISATKIQIKLCSYSNTVNVNKINITDQICIIIAGV